MEAIILAGGFGTRIRSTIGEVPKPMAPIDKDNNTVPFLAVLLEYLQNSGIKKVVFAVHYLKDQIIDYFGHSFKGIEIRYSIEDKPLGTGGAIVKASQYINDDKFLVLNGDTFLDCDYKELYKNEDLTLVLKHMNNCTRYGRVVTEKNKIIEFVEKGAPKEGLINGGIYLVTKKDLKNLHGTFSFETDFLHKKKNIRAFITNGYFIDIGVPEDYKDAKESLCKNVFS